MCTCELFEPPSDEELSLSEWLDTRVEQIEDSSADSDPWDDPRLLQREHVISLIAEANYEAAESVAALR